MLEYLKRTDDVGEMTKIGRRIVESNPDMYTKNAIRSSLVKIGRVRRDCMGGSV